MTGLDKTPADFPTMNSRRYISKRKIRLNRSHWQPIISESQMTLKSHLGWLKSIIRYT